MARPPAARVGGGLAEIFGKAEQVSAVDPGTGGKIFHIGQAPGWMPAPGGPVPT